METIDSAIVLFNSWGRAWWDFAGGMFLQSGILAGLLLIADLCLRKRVSARFRYAMWLLVLVKLALPPSLTMPTGANYWLSKYLPAASAPASPADAFPTAPPEHVGSVWTGDASPSTMTQIDAASPAVSLQGPGWALLAWIAGVLLLLAIVLWRIASVRRSLVRSRPAGPEMTALLEECRADLGIASQVTLRLIDDRHPPAVCGFFHPVILLPRTLPPGLGTEGLRAIFTHELTHVKRYDPWVNLAQIVLQVLYFWHPFVWAANARLRHLRELAVDETVLAAMRSQAQCYTDTLIDIATMAFRKPAFSLRLIGIAESKRALERRITHMLKGNTSNRTAPGWSGLLAILALGAVLVPMGRYNGAPALAQQQALQSVPALPPGIAPMFQLDKDGVLRRFGKPSRIFYGDQVYTLDDLPNTYYLPYDDVSFCINDGTVVGITLLDPSYVFGNGIHVGDSEGKVKQAFGPPSSVKETEFKDFLNYESLGLSFEINKQNRSVMEINIERDYDDPARLEAYAGAEEFAASLPQKLAKFDIDKADLKQVIATFGKPIKYVWGPKTLSADELLNRFIAVYPGSFNVFMLNDRVVEVRHERGSKYVFAGKLHVGSTLEEALAVLGPPAKTVRGEPIDWQDSRNVLFRDIDGTKGHDYYHRPDRNVRVWFWNDEIIAIYMTRGDYGKDDEPADPEFARLLPERIARLNIDTANLEKVKEIFGEPQKYVWSDKTFQADSLPDNYIMCYPCAFRVWLRDDRIMEIRHERASPYVYRGKLRIGSTLQDALDLLGRPDETVTGQENAFKDKVLYKNIEGERGHDYYHRADQNVRIWFSADKVIAIYMTRSDFPAGR